MKKCKVIAVINQKGGVGKTTTCINMGASFATLGKKVLLIDMDPQGNATTGLGIAKHEDFINELGKKDQRQTDNIYTVMSGQIDVLSKGLIRATAVDGLDIIPSSIDLSAIEIEITSMEDREKVLARIIEPLLSRYDYIIMDCPPSLSLITINTMVACDCVLIPIQCEFYAMEGLAQLLNTVKIVKKFLNPRLDVSHVMLTMYNGRYRLHHQVMEEMCKYFGDKLFRTKIPQNIKLAEAPSFGKPAILYDKGCSGAKAYLHAAQEFLAKEKKR